MERNWHGIIGCLIASLILIGIGCTTDPIIPATGIPVEPPVQDPGVDSLCPDGVISFRHQILPLMISSCAYSGCHDVVSAEEGIVLDTYENVRREVKPGNPNDSKLYESIIESDPDDIMPPPPADPLTNEQINLIREWIVQGAENTTCGTPCDPAQTSFSMTIFPLLQDYCVGCHNSARMDGDVNLESYGKIVPYVENGYLLGTVRADQFFPVMPPSGSQLSACRITQIEQWIQEGALNN